MSRKPHIYPLTSLRFFAALFVVVFHIEYVWFTELSFMDGSIRNILKCGFSSVGFFFILSGFVLAYNYGERGRILFKKYLQARVARIYPVYFFATLFAAPSAIAFLANKYEGSQLIIQTGAGLFANLLFLTAWLPDFSYWNYPGWSLSAEIFFYLMFPLILPWVWQRTVKQCLFWMGLSVVLLTTFQGTVIAVSSVETLEAMSVNPLFRFVQFFIGLLLARVYFQSDKIKGISANWVYLPFVLLVAVFAFSQFYHREFLHTGLIDLVSVAIIIFLAQRPTALTAWLSHPVLVLLGEASYALYILHVPLRDLMRAVLNRMSWAQAVPDWIWGLSYIALSLALSVIVYKCLEVPARKYINGLGKTSKA